MVRLAPTSIQSERTNVDITLLNEDHRTVDLVGNVVDDLAVQSAAIT